MVFRPFTCSDCGHKMRFRGDYCGKCYALKNTFQKPSTWYLILAAAIVLILLALIVLL